MYSVKVHFFCAGHCYSYFHYDFDRFTAANEPKHKSTPWVRNPSNKYT